MFRRGGGFGLWMESLPEEGETISGQTTAVLTTPTESTEGEHLVRWQGRLSAVHSKALKVAHCGAMLPFLHSFKDPRLRLLPNLMNLESGNLSELAVKRGTTRQTILGWITIVSLAVTER